MPVKHDKRVITHATPPLVTVKAAKSGNAHLKLRMATQRCEHHSHGNPNGCSDRGRVAVTRTVPTDTGIRVERLCLEHLTNPPQKPPTIDEIMELLYDPKDMTQWNWKWDGGS